MKTINYEEEHRKLWNWLADHPEAIKADYFKNWDLVDYPYNLCFACEAAKLYGPVPNNDLCCCWYCPLGGDQVVGCKDGLYIDWWRAKQPEKRRKLARTIANLPWKEKKEEELRGER